MSFAITETLQPAPITSVPRNSSNTSLSGLHSETIIKPIPSPALSAGSTRMPARTIPFSRVMSSVDYRSMHFVVLDCPTEHTLALYVEELKNRHVTDVVRVCEPTYDRTVMEQNGIRVHDWPFADGTIPPANIIMNFLNLCDERFTGGISGAASRPELSEGEAVNGPCIAIHCVAGLGRAPVLVAMALIESGMAPLDAVEFVRRRRRGAFNSVQLTHLVDSYRKMWKKSSGVSKFGLGRRPASPTFGRKANNKECEEESGAVTASHGLRAKASFMKVFSFGGRKSPPA